MHTHNNVQFSTTEKTEFFATLRHRVNESFNTKKQSQKGNYKLYIKSIFFLITYILPLVLINLHLLNALQIIIAYAAMGFAMVGIGMSIMHDAIHGSYSKYNWVNVLMGRTIDLVGGNATSWQIQHNLLHHTYTNIYGHDEDIEDKPMLRLSASGKWTKFHRFQSYYAIFLYGLTTISWVTNKDFKQIFDYHKRGLLQKVGKKFNATLLQLIAFKALYFCITLVLPIYMNFAAWQYVVLGFVVMHLLAGTIMTVVFQLAHVVEQTIQPIPNEDGVIENNWAIHQLQTTANFAPANKLLSWYIGGLNYQIEHHLFAHISHIHYPEIAKIVKRTAQEFGIPYHEYATLTQAVRSHWKMLHQLGNPQ